MNWIRECFVGGGGEGEQDLGISAWNSVKIVVLREKFVEEYFGGKIRPIDRTTLLPDHISVIDRPDLWRVIPEGELFITDPSNIPCGDNSRWRKRSNKGINFVAARSRERTRVYRTGFIDFNFSFFLLFLDAISRGWRSVDRILLYFKRYPFRPVVRNRYRYHRGQTIFFEVDFQERHEGRRFSFLASKERVARRVGRGKSLKKVDEWFIIGRIMESGLDGECRWREERGARRRLVY